ncbi:uncharacterized protein L969DRAFT_49206 [Mixia osmundae IAM 14324]|uniref:Chromatin modification-related protein n=1 Tax=Mixia osmundae (strain CBS 9802 / IAM 14324 / JCM 22182 / KY 12970) TaxID=764103 RepID=G7DVR6_MIXOS|nr:uncharacterized protein L969DRAFT_49206 [Mixia osmundae IAM 14324]KEI39643.1 hypothetical protein L969DRAFT_49206 [Mixia osmundae IAM 14324]GAA94676.1 hypothetical protein E5Q_01329 [Mixia osmundae IAM 14324]
MTSLGDEAYTLLNDLVSSYDNLPSEIGHLMAEIRAKSDDYSACSMKARQRDAAIQKWHKLHGLSIENPKEVLLIEKINKNLGECRVMADDKIKLAERALRLVDRHLAKMNGEMTRLAAQNPALLAQPNLYGAAGLSAGLQPVFSGVEDMLANDEMGSVRSHKRKHHHANGTITVPTVPSIAMPNYNKDKARSRLSQSYVSQGGNNKRVKYREDESALTSDDLLVDDVEEGGDAGEDTTEYCFCHRTSFGDMVACDNDDCEYEWFHWSCVGLKQAPDPSKKWYCPACRSGGDQASRDRRAQKARQRYYCHYSASLVTFEPVDVDGSAHRMSRGPQSLTRLSPHRFVAHEAWVKFERARVKVAAHVESTHYDTLAVTRQASQAEIRSAYLRLILQHHPDKLDPDRLDDNDKSRAIVQAFAVLGKSDSRAQYDRELSIAQSKIKGKQSARAATIDLEEMAELEMARDGMEGYSFPCRCGSAFVLSSHQLTEAITRSSEGTAAKHTLAVPCQGCSLVIDVEYYDDAFA